MFKKLLVVALLAGTLMTASSSSASAAPYRHYSVWHGPVCCAGPCHRYHWDRFHHFHR